MFSVNVANDTLMRTGGKNDGVEEDSNADDFG
jgi:hypothetical protein